MRRRGIRYFNDKNQARGAGGEQAQPYDKTRVHPSDIARTRALSGPVKTWADMSAEERAQVLASLRGRKP